MRRTIDERVEAAKEEIKQKEIRLRELLQAQKKQERKDRNHRFCQRGGLVEKLLPDMARLTDEQFEIFVEKVLLTPHTNRILAGLVPPIPDEQENETDTVQENGATVTISAGAAARTIESPDTGIAV